MYFQICTFQICTVQVCTVRVFTVQIYKFQVYTWTHPILGPFIVVSIFRFMLKLSHLKVVLLIRFSLVIWLFHSICHFFLWVFKEFLKLSYVKRSSMLVSLSEASFCCIYPRFRCLKKKILYINHLLLILQYQSNK